MPRRKSAAPSAATPVPNETGIKPSPSVLSGASTATQPKVKSTNTEKQSGPNRSPVKAEKGQASSTKANPKSSAGVKSQSKQSSPDNGKKPKNSANKSSSSDGKSIGPLTIQTKELPGRALPQPKECAENRKISKIVSSGSKSEPENSFDESTFRLAATTPVPISSIIERQFYESVLFLFTLERVRGDHTKRQNYHGELDQDETELRRSFIDKLAYICDFRKGGSTVTSLGLQKTPQGVTFWLAANETVRPHVKDFLTSILQLLSKVEVDGASKKGTESQLLSKIVPYNKERLDYYWSVLEQQLPLCISRINEIEELAIGKPTSKELRNLRNLLSTLPDLAQKDRMLLVRECFDARTKSQSFSTLAQLTANGRAYSRFFDDIRHILGRLGEHVKAAKILVSAAIRFPALFDDFEIQIQRSHPSSCFFQSPHDVSLDGLAARIFKGEEEISHYQRGIDYLAMMSNGTLLDRFREECCFKTRVHAELLLVDLFYWRQFEFVDGDPYIGCSKPACFSCYQYTLAHPGNFILPACHKKIYLAWRAPDILEEGVPISLASETREVITKKINSAIRVELRRQIDGRCPKRAAQFDSVTGTSSSVQGLVLASGISVIESESPSVIEDDPKSSSEENSNPTTMATQPTFSDGQHSSSYDDSDDDLSWYKSRIGQSRLLLRKTIYHNEPSVLVLSNK